MRSAAAPSYYDVDGFPQTMIATPASSSTARVEVTELPDLYTLAKPLLEAGGKDNKQDEARFLKNVELALLQGASPHSWLGPETPLRGAVLAPCPGLVHALLAAQAAPDKCDEKGVRPMHIAAYAGQVDICRILLQARATPNCEDRYGQTPLFFCASVGACALIHRSHADLNKISQRGQSVLHLSARDGRHEVLGWFLERATPALVSLRDVHGATAADYARSAGVRPEILQSLLEVPTNASPTRGNIIGHVHHQRQLSPAATSRPVPGQQKALVGPTAQRQMQQRFVQSDHKNAHGLYLGGASGARQHRSALSPVTSNRLR